METGTMRGLPLAAESGAALRNSISASSLTAVWTTTGTPSKATERSRSNGCWRPPNRACRALRAGSASSTPAARMHRKTS